MTYAAKSPIPAEKTKAQIEAMLTKSGADQIGYFLGSADCAVVMFRKDSICVKITLYLPSLTDEDIQRDPQGKKRSEQIANSILEQSRRSHWRSLMLIIKAKLEAIEKGISTTEREFFIDSMVPGTNVTMAEYLGPHLAQIRAGAPISSLMLSGDR